MFPVYYGFYLLDTHLSFSGLYLKYLQLLVIGLMMRRSIPGQREGFKGHKDLGGCLVIQMDGGAIVTMGHLSETYVREGFRVLRGDVLGRQGSTGRSTGEHLHFAVAIDGETINPFGYFMEGM